MCGRSIRSPRRISRGPSRRRLRSKRSLGPLLQRRETVEHPFGTIKQWMNQGAFVTRDLENVRGEFSLTALAYNIRRVLNITTFAELMAAVQS